jgi:class 3 adenylate cyclase
LKAEQSGFLKMTTRRLAAILAADVAGFSALMERDEEGTFARIGSLRREVIEPYLSEHQGRLIKTTGDGFLVEFASPIAALRCALAIQANLRNDPDALRLRIGLNLNRPGACSSTLTILQPQRPSKKGKRRQQVSV